MNVQKTFTTVLIWPDAPILKAASTVNVHLALSCQEENVEVMNSLRKGNIVVCTKRMPFYSDIF